jgi:hypothetical protein
MESIIKWKELTSKRHVYFLLTFMRLQFKKKVSTNCEDSKLRKKNQIGKTNRRFKQLIRPLAKNDMTLGHDSQYFFTKEIITIGSKKNNMT